VLGGAAGAVAAAAAVLVAMLPGGSSHARELPPPRARVYTARQACLLTGARGVADPAAAPVWAGMRDASAATHAEVTYLAVPGEQTPANAAPYLATLAARPCTVVLAAGTAAAGAVPATGPKFPHTRFLVVDPPAAAHGGPNVTAVDGTRGAVASAVEDVLRR
jgi:hypothetical protein